MQRVPGGWIEGKLLGLELAVVEWRQLASVPLEGPVALHVDADYFVRVPQDRIWARPRVIVTALQECLDPGMEMTLSRSVGSGFVPLRHRFIADHLATLWTGRQEEAGHWQHLLELETEPMPPAERAAALRALRSVRPDCAATCHALAVETTDAHERELLLAKAAALDPHYAADVLRHLGAVHFRRHDAELAGVVRPSSAYNRPSATQAASWRSGLSSQATSSRCRRTTLASSASCRRKCTAPRWRSTSAA